MEDTLVVVIIALFLSIVALLIIGFCLFKGKRTQSKVSKNENNFDTEGEDDLGSFETYDKLDFSFDKKRKENEQADDSNVEIQQQEEAEEDSDSMVTIPMPESIKTDMEQSQLVEEEQPIFETQETNEEEPKVEEEKVIEEPIEVTETETVVEQEEVPVEQPIFETNLSVTQVFQNLASDIKAELDNEDKSVESELTEEQSEEVQEEVQEENTEETEVTQETNEEVEDKLSNTQIIRNLSVEVQKELENGNFEEIKPEKPDLSKTMDFFNEVREHRERIQNEEQQEIQVEVKEETKSSTQDVVNVQIKGKNYIFLANGNDPQVGKEITIILNGREYPATITRGVYQKDIDSLKIKPKDLVIKED